jgi:hypothetical protein
MDMENIFVYVGHSTHDIFEDNVQSGQELFDKSRIRVPEGYRFITFHFNNMPDYCKFYRSFYFIWSKRYYTS